MKPAVLVLSESSAWKRWNDTPADDRYVIGGELAIKGSDGRYTILKFRRTRDVKVPLVQGGEKR